ncbi:MAG: hypothetical protein WCK63_15335 [Betaproteobacteria bacterium]
MSQQINLYETRLRPQHELFTGRNVAVALGVLLTLMVVLSGFTRVEADRASAELVKAQADVRSALEKIAALTKSLGERKISPALQGELDAARTILAARSEAMDYLDSGRLGSNAGFSGVMQGFSRVAQSDLWLTGFSVSQGGLEIEIRGSMLDSTQLPGYVQHLSTEPAFQGRRFAALEMKRVDPAEMSPGSVVDHSAAVPEPGRPRVEFVLRSEQANESTAPIGAKK